MRRLPVLAVLLLLAPPVRADRVLAGGPVPEPAEAAAETPGADPEALASAQRPWKLCRVRWSLLVASVDGTRIVASDEPLLFHGEELEFERDVPLERPERAALVRVRARIRAAIADARGVLYHVTTQGRLTSTIGFAAEEAGQDQTRHAYVRFEDPTSHLHEVFASPTLGLRLILGLAAEPVVGREESPLDDILPPSGNEPLISFHVEALRREGAASSLLDRADLTATRGHDAVFSVAQLGARKAVTDPEHPLGGKVLVRDLGVLPDTGYGDDHAVAVRPVGETYTESHAVPLDDSFLETHEVPVDTSDDPRHFTVRAKARKLSARQRAKVKAQQEIAEVKRMADERSRTLPSGEALPEGYRREELTLRVTPLHSSATNVQVQLRLVGQVKLPGESELTSVDTVLVEELVRGEPFEVGLVELARGAPAATDYVFRITAAH